MTSSCWLAPTIRGNLAKLIALTPIAAASKRVLLTLWNATTRSIEELELTEWRSGRVG